MRSTRSSRSDYSPAAGRGRSMCVCACCGRSRGSSISSAYAHQARFVLGTLELVCTVVGQTDEEEPACSLHACSPVLAATVELATCQCRAALSNIANTLYSVELSGTPSGGTPVGWHTSRHTVDAHHVPPPHCGRGGQQDRSVMMSGGSLQPVRRCRLLLPSSCLLPVHAPCLASPTWQVRVKTSNNTSLPDWKGSERL